MGGISVWQLLIVALIVILLFGTKKLKGIGGDLGSAIKGFKKAMKEDDQGKGDNKDADFNQQPQALKEEQKQNTEHQSEKDKHNV